MCSEISKTKYGVHVARLGILIDTAYRREKMCHFCSIYVLQKYDKNVLYMSTLIADTRIYQIGLAK